MGILSPAFWKEKERSEAFLEHAVFHVTLVQNNPYAKWHIL